MKILRQFLLWIRKWLWSKPTKPVKESRAKVPIEEVQHAYKCIKFEGQWILLWNNQIAAFEALTLSEKRKIKKRMAHLVQKGKIIFKEVDGKMTCIQNKSYADRPRKNNG